MSKDIWWRHIFECGCEISTKDFLEVCPECGEKVIEIYNEWDGLKRDIDADV